MSSKSPVFPFPEPQHFSDYGFDPQIDYFQQVLEEAKKHKRSASTSLDSIQFNLQKPISKHQSTKKRWWKNPMLFFKCIHHQNDAVFSHPDVHQARARSFRASFSGPVCLTQTTTASTTRPASGPLASNLTHTIKSEIPYLSLRQLNMEQQQYRSSTSAGKPVYLVN